MKLIEVNAAKEFAHTFLADPILKMAVNAVLDNAPAATDTNVGIKQIPATNADRIRAMTDEELAKFIPDWSYTNACKCDELPYVDCNNECEKCVLEWLRQPAGEV